MANLCRLSAFAFMGHLPDPGDPLGFDEYDLINGIAYCEDWMEMGLTHDAIDKFSFNGYIEWAKQMLKTMEEQK